MNDGVMWCFIKRLCKVKCDDVLNVSCRCELPNLGISNQEVNKGRAAWYEAMHAALVAEAHYHAYAHSIVKLQLFLVISRYNYIS